MSGSEFENCRSGCSDVPQARDWTVFLQIELYPKFYVILPYHTLYHTLRALKRLQFTGIMKCATDGRHDFAETMYPDVIGQSPEIFYHEVFPNPHKDIHASGVGYPLTRRCLDWICGYDFEEI